MWIVAITFIVLGSLLCLYSICAFVAANGIERAREGFRGALGAKIGPQASESINRMLFSEAFSSVMPPRPATSLYARL